MTNLTAKARSELKAKLLNEQCGVCAYCRKGPYRSPSHWGKDEQPVNTLDHNHLHVGCAGCTACARGMVHAFCNRQIALVATNAHLRNPFIDEYLMRGCGPHHLPPKGSLRIISGRWSENVATYPAPNDGFNPKINKLRSDLVGAEVSNLGVVEKPFEVSSWGRAAALFTGTSENGLRFIKPIGVNIFELRRGPVWAHMEVMGVTCS